MLHLESFVDLQLAKGRGYFTRKEAIEALSVSEGAFSASATRLIKKSKLTQPRHGFYLILRPEDRSLGAPDPAQWIGPLMSHQGLDYRVSLLRAAAWHGASHQAAMVFQVVAPKQQRDIEIGRYRLQFLFQTSRGFVRANQSEYIERLKTPAGYAKVAGAELTLFDCVRYLHEAGGINGVAQVIKDIGGKADPKRLAGMASAYEGSVARRLGYLLELAGHARQADALARLVSKAKTYAPLDPSIKPLVASLVEDSERAPRWKLEINETVEFDT